MDEEINLLCKTCDICQHCKKISREYGKVPPKLAEARPWHTLCVDLIGPYRFDWKGKKMLILNAVTMMCPATGWLEIKEIKGRTADVVANAVETR